MTTTTPPVEPADDEQLVALHERIARLEQELRAARQRQDQAARHATLGRLVPGVAHELNNALGAIGAAMTGARQQLRELPQELLRLFQWCSDPREYRLAMRLIEHTGARREDVDFRTRRRIRARHCEVLEALGLDDAESIADELVQLGLHDDPTPWLPLLRHPQALELLETIDGLTTLVGSIEDAHEATGTAAATVSALGRYGRRHAEPTTAPIQAGIEAVLTLHHQTLKYGVEVKRHFTALPELVAFHDQLDQVWASLVTNAIEAMEGKGTLHIRLLGATRGATPVQRVSFEDTGRGIDDATRARLFEPGFGTTPDGEGMGLAVARRIIERHGGSITIDNRAEPGACVCVELPQSPPRSDDAALAAAPSVAPL